MRILFVENHAVFASTVLDYDLDDERGDLLLHHLRSEGRSTPVVAVSARAEGNESLVRAGAAAVCAKGDFARITEILAQVCKPWREDSGR